MRKLYTCGYLHCLIEKALHVAKHPYFNTSGKFDTSYMRFDQSMFLSQKVSIRLFIKM